MLWWGARHWGEIKALAISPSGDEAVTGALAFGRPDPDIRLWTLPSVELKTRFNRLLKKGQSKRSAFSFFAS